MCSIEEAWAGQTFSGKPVVSQSDIHNSYMSLPDDISNHNNQFSMKHTEAPVSRNLARGINSKYSRESRVPKIVRNSNNANINISSQLPPLNNYGGITPRPPYMEIYDNDGPVPVMTGENFTDIENAYNVSSTVNNFMEKGLARDMESNFQKNMFGNLLTEDTYEEQDIINNKFTNKQKNDEFTNIKQSSKYNSSDKVMISSDDKHMIQSSDPQILLILQQLITKLNKIENDINHQNSRNMCDIILYILIGMILSFILYSLISHSKK